MHPDQYGHAHAGPVLAPSMDRFSIGLAEVTAENTKNFSPVNQLKVLENCSSCTCLFREIARTLTIAAGTQEHR